MATTPVLSSDGKQSDQEAGKLFNLLDSPNLEVVDQITKLIHENLQAIRESWFLGSLVEYYFVTHSKRVMNILADVREPHDKHLLDKLNEYMKNSETRVFALSLLLYIISKQPSWSHKLVQFAVFQTIMKCLKTDEDIPSLMTAVLVVTLYLPMNPPAMGNSLSDLFGIFTRLIAFPVRKPGNVPDVFLLHLQVAVYALFHRLYGMYPCNFLAYLRQHFSKPENQQVYQDIIKPMIERVRLHPMLITGSKENETTTKRWRRLEVQDIVVDCAKMSLDMIEGTWEELGCPVRAHSILRARASLESSRAASRQADHENRSVIHDPDVMSPQFGQAVMLCHNTQSYMTDSSLWSPSAICGLSTPPPNQANPTAMLLGVSQADMSNTSMTHSQGGTFSSTPFLTPSDQTPRATPPVLDDLFDRSLSSRNNSRGSIVRSENRHHSGGNTSSSTKPHAITVPHINMSAAISGLPDIDTPSPAVPPSPMKPDFTSEPPVGMHKAQPRRAIQELKFDAISEHSDANDVANISNQHQQMLAAMPRPSLSKLHPHLARLGIDRSLNSLTINFQKTTEFKSSRSRNTSGNSDEHRPHVMLHDVLTSSLSQDSLDGPIMSHPSVLSVRSLERVILDLDQQEHDIDLVDQEVSHITKEPVNIDSDSDDDDPVDPHLQQMTAASVKQFMKNVNRIRFNSLTVSTEKPKEALTKPGKMLVRSFSCPMVQGMIREDHEEEIDEDTNEVARSTSALIASADHGPCLNEERQELVSGANQSVIVTAPLTDGRNLNIPGINVTASGYSVQQCISVSSLQPANIAMPTDTTYTVSNPTITVAHDGPSSVNQTSGIDSVLSTLQHYLNPRGEDDAEMNSLLSEPVWHVLQSVLPSASVVECQRCKMHYFAAVSQSNWNILQPNCRPPDIDYETPLFTTFSPPELLDRHLRMGSEIHAKELHNIPMTSQDSINWTHFGGIPPADEVNILRGQILLIQNQLMYERHKRELHARRNRRLLRKIADAKAVEEQNTARMEQLRLQEDEIQSLHVSLKLLQEENQQLRNCKESNDYERQVQYTTCQQENENLRFARSELQNLIVHQKSVNDELTRQLQNTDYELFNSKQELKVLQNQVIVAQELQDQITCLNKELLLMGELHQRYQEQMSQKLLHQAKPENEYLMTTLQAENKQLRTERDHHQSLSIHLQAKVNELEEQLRTKDLTVTEINHQLEATKSSHHDQLKATESKYRTSVKISQQLESHILDLYSHIDNNTFSQKSAKKQDKSIAQGLSEVKTQPEIPAKTRASSEPAKPPSLSSISSVSRLQSAPTASNQSSSFTYDQSPWPPPLLPQQQKQADSIATADIKLESTTRLSSSNATTPQTQSNTLQSATLWQINEPCSSAASNPPRSTGSVVSHDSIESDYSDDKRSASSRTGSNALSDSGFVWT